MNDLFYEKYQKQKHNMELLQGLMPQFPSSGNHTGSSQSPYDVKTSTATHSPMIPNPLNVNPHVRSHPTEFSRELGFMSMIPPPPMPYYFAKSGGGLSSMTTMQTTNTPTTTVSEANPSRGHYQTGPMAQGNVGFMTPTGYSNPPPTVPMGNGLTNSMNGVYSTAPHPMAQSTNFNSSQTLNQSLVQSQGQSQGHGPSQSQGLKNTPPTNPNAHQDSHKSQTRAATAEEMGKMQNTPMPRVLQFSSGSK